MALKPRQPRPGINNKAHPNRWLSVADLSKRIGVSDRTIWRAINQNQIAAYGGKGYWLVDTEHPAYAEWKAQALARGDRYRDSLARARAARKAKRDERNSSVEPTEFITSR